MLSKVAHHNLIEGLMPRVIACGILSLQYADDTTLFLKTGVEMARHLKWLLACFEQMLGLRINYQKSDLMPITYMKMRATSLLKSFSQLVNSPLNTLGVPLHYAELQK
jgi:hypothetical protein